MDTDQFDMPHALDPFEGSRQLAQVDTELVFLHAGRDLGVRMRVDFRIDTEGDRSDLVLPCGQLLDHLQFGDRLDVKAENVVIQSQVDFPVRLTDAGEDDLVIRESRLERRLDLAATHAIGTKTVLGD